MKAMVLAAGFGTRLRPLTDDRPKALVEVGGRTMLEVTLSRLRSFGIQEVMVNVYHFGGMIQNYLAANQNFGMQVEVSVEDVLLDTGGGLKKAAGFFAAKEHEQDEPFVVHNVDVLSTIDLTRMMQFHKEQGALATLAVQHRTTSRYLVFHRQGQLCGRAVKGEEVEGSNTEKRELLAFCGIHIVSPRLLRLMTEDGAFSIMDTYVRLAAAGEKIAAFRADEFYWRDLGRPDSVAQASEDVRRKII